tara:strand:- start:1820 stop:2380 length:561 start_codon:yes stop_codon:yes gene_type:complete
MASQLGYSFVDETMEKNININNNVNVKRRQNSKRHNKTYKQTKINKSKISNFLKSMDDAEEGEVEGLANFNPPKLPELTKQPEQNEEYEIDDEVSPENFKDMDANQASYYNNYIPYYTKASNNRNVHGSRDELMTKLNYMIHLMEEQKDEKTDHVNEELVLYMFLGVFVIFVVDSFARAGKYKRGI